MGVGQMKEACDILEIYCPEPCFVPTPPPDMEISRLSSDVEIASEQKAAAERESQRYMNKSRTLQTDLEQLKAEFYDDKTEVAAEEQRLRGENERLRLENTNQVQNFQEENQKLIEQKNRFMKEKTDLEKDMANIYSKMKSDGQKHTASVQKYEEDLEQQAQKLQSAENRIKNYENKLYSVQADLDAANESNSQNDNLINRLRKQCDTSGSQIEDFEIQNQESLLDGVKQSIYENQFHAIVSRQ